MTNGYKFSYPGYNEMLTGKPDPRIDRNDYGPNPNTTVFEWLAGTPEFAGKVAAFGTWDVFGAIFNQDRAPMWVRAGWDLPFPGDTAVRRVLLDTLYATTTRVWQEMPYDAFMQAVVMEYVETERPQVLYIGYGETDEWAHEGRYDQYLDLGAPGRRIHPRPLECHAGDAGVRGHDDVHHHDRSWTGKRAQGVAESRRQSGGGGVHLGGGARSGDAGTRRPA